MSYLGPRSETGACYRRGFRVGLGDVSVPGGTLTRVVYDYRCEHCGTQTAGQLFQATEAFYCPGCRALISIEPAR